MKYKSIFLITALVLIAAGCNRKTTNSNTNSVNVTQDSANQTNQQTQVPSNTTGTNTAANSDNGAPNPTHFSGEGDMDTAPQPEVLEVDMTANGFSPSTITVRKGDYVEFVNKDTVPHWPASNPHPTHTDLPGFDAKQLVQPGQNYKYQFQKVGTWGYHDHTNPVVMGKVIVQ